MPTKTIWQAVQRWGPAVFISAVIFIASATPSKELPSFGVADFLVKKGGHMLGYALLALCLIRGVGARQKDLLWIVIGLVFLYGCTDEFHQLFVAGRTSKFSDVLIDTTGGTIGYLFWLIFPRMRWLTSYRDGNSNLFPLSR